MSLSGSGFALLSVAGYAVVATGVGLVVRWQARRYYLDPETDPETALHLRRLRHRGFLVGWLLTVGVSTWLGTPTALRVALATVAPGSVADLVGPLATYALPAVPVAVAVRLATVPYRQAVRGLRLRYRDVAAWELERDGVGLLGILAAATLVALAPAGWPRVLTAVGLGLVATALTPFALVVAFRTRLPTDEERAVVDDVLRGCRLRVVDDRTRVGSALAAGILPRARYVFLTESLFDALSPGELRAVAAHEVGHHERGHVLLRFTLAALAAAGALALAEFVPGVALPAILAGALPVTLALAWVVRRTEASADAYAAAVVGGPALASALETLAERRYVFESGGRFRALSYHPPLGERIADLRGQTAGPSPT